MKLLTKFKSPKVFATILTFFLVFQNVAPVMAIVSENENIVEPALPQEDNTATDLIESEDEPEVDIIEEEEIIETAPSILSSSIEANKITFGSIQTETQYKYHNNELVNVTFLSLPKGDYYLSIEQVETEYGVGYEILSNLENGTFLYNLNLPASTNDVEIKYSEDGVSFESVQNNLQQKSESVTIYNLNHFTIFVVTPVDPLNDGNDILPGTTIVTPVSSGNWYYYTYYNSSIPTAAGASVSFEIGPDSLPNGSLGSLKLQSGTRGSKAIMSSNEFDGIKLSDITDLSYDTYVSSSTGANLAPYINIYFDLDNNGIYDGGVNDDFITFSTSEAGETVVLNSWQSWDLTSVDWYSRYGKLTNGVRVRDIFTSIQTNFPNATIIDPYNTGGGGFIINGGDSSTEGWSNFTGYVDNLVLNSHNYDFEPAIQLLPSDSKFVESPKYVRENNAGDLAAEVHVTNLVSAVRFQLNGGAYIDGTYTNQVNSSLDRWILRTAIPAGEYIVTGEMLIGSTWYPITGSGVVYSIDLPNVEYIKPGVDGEIVRPGDNPVRIKHEDEFNQFNNATFELYSYDSSTSLTGGLIGSYTINRSDCDLRQAGNYVLCDINTSSTWVALAEGEYKVRLETNTYANNGIRFHNNFWSKYFLVDGTRPTVDYFDTEPEGVRVFKNSLSVKALASDATPGDIEHVSFYFRTPRADGQCVDNEAAGTATLAQNILNDGDNIYTHTFDTTSLADGEYCVFAKAMDTAKNHSNPAQSIKITIDKTPPSKPVMKTIINRDTGAVLGCGGYTNTTNIKIEWEQNPESDIAGYWFGTRLNPKHKYVTYPTTFYNGSMTPGNAPYYYTIIAVDNVGNESEISDQCGLILDQTSPVATITSHNDGDIVHGTIDITGVVTDEYLSHYWFVVVNQSGTQVAGPDKVDSTDNPMIRTFSWNTNNVDDGVYTIKLEARDKAGNKSPNQAPVLSDPESPTDSIDWVQVTVNNLTKVSGYKFEDINQNGVWDEGEDGLANWVIEVVEAEQNGLVPVALESAISATTDENGYFEMYLPVGTHTLCEINQPGWVQTFPEACHEVIVTGDDLEISINSSEQPLYFGNYFDLFPVISLTGPASIILGQTATFVAEVVDGGNEPYTIEWGGECALINSLSYELTPANIGNHSCSVTITDLDGDTHTANFTVVVNPLPVITDPNTTPVTTPSPTVTNTQTTSSVLGFGDGFPESSLVTTSQAEENEEGSVLGLTCESPSLTNGYVYYDENNNSKKDSSEKGLKNVTVRVYMNENGERTLVSKTKTDDNGYWQTNLCPGDYEVEIDKDTLPDDAKISDDDLVKGISIKADEELNDVNFEIDKDGFNFNVLWCLIPLAILGLLSLGYYVLNRDKSIKVKEN